jgi:hypothetical protein
MSGQIIDASPVPAPKQRNTDDERQAIKDGKSAQDIWPDDPPRRHIRTQMRAGRSRSGAGCATRMASRCR